MKKPKKPLLKMGPLLKVGRKKPPGKALVPAGTTQISPEVVRPVQSLENAPDGSLRFQMRIQKGQDVREFGISKAPDGSFQAWTNRQVSFGKDMESPIKAAGMFMDLFRDYVSPAALRPPDEDLLELLLPDEFEELG